MSSNKPAQENQTTQSSNQNSSTTGSTNLSNTALTGGVTSNTSTSTVPQWQQDAWKSLLGNVNGAVGNSSINTPAGVTNAADYSNNFINSSLPGIQSTFNAGTQGIQNQQVDADKLASNLTSNDPYKAYSADPNSTWNSGTAKQYMNPYTDTVAKARHDLATNQLNQELSGVDSNFAASGALGGDRNSVERANLTSQANRQMAADDVSALNDAYSSGQLAYQSDQARKLQSASGTAGVQQNAAQDLLAGKSSNIYGNFAAGQNAANQVNTTNAALSGASGLGTAAQGSNITTANFPLSQYQTQAGILSALPNQSTVSSSGTNQSLTQGNTQGDSTSNTVGSSQSNGNEKIYKNSGNPFMQLLGAGLQGASMFLSEGGIVNAKKSSKKKMAKKKKK